MSTELIIILTVLGLGGLIGLFYISHAIEKQRRQKAVMIAGISDQAFRLQRLLDFIPPVYTPREVRLLILNQIKKHLERLVELSPGNDKFTKKLDACSAHISEAQTATKPLPPPQLKTPDEANELRAMLQELTKTIEYFVQTKALSAPDAQRHLATIQNSFIDANLNYLLQMGQTARQEKKPKLAIHHFQKAMAEMQKRNQTGHYSEKIEQIKQLIAELQTESGIEPVTQATEGNSELTSGMDELMEEKDAWKKKYF